MGFLVDTNLWIAVERGDIDPADIYSITKQSPVYLSSIYVAEIRHGIERMRRKPLLRITGETGEIFGELSAKLSKARRGADFRIQDLWLAAQAIQRDFKLLTANAKDFKDIPGLKWVDVKI